MFQSNRTSINSDTWVISVPFLIGTLVAYLCFSMRFGIILIIFITCVEDTEASLFSTNNEWTLSIVRRCVNHLNRLDIVKSGPSNLVGKSNLPVIASPDMAEIIGNQYKKFIAELAQGEAVARESSNNTDRRMIKIELPIPALDSSIFRPASLNKLRGDLTLTGYSKEIIDIANSAILLQSKGHGIGFLYSHAVGILLTFSAENSTAAGKIASELAKEAPRFLLVGSPETQNRPGASYYIRDNGHGVRDRSNAEFSFLSIPLNHIHEGEIYEGAIAHEFDHIAILHQREIGTPDYVYGVSSRIDLTDIGRLLKRHGRLETSIYDPYVSFDEGRAHLISIKREARKNLALLELNLGSKNAHRSEFSEEDPLLGILDFDREIFADLILNFPHVLDLTIKSIEGAKVNLSKVDQEDGFWHVEIPVETKIDTRKIQVPVSKGLADSETNAVQTVKNNLEILARRSKNTLEKFNLLKKTFDHQWQISTPQERPEKLQQFLKLLLTIEDI